MRAGSLKLPVVIERATAERNSLGESILRWAEINQVWGEVQPLSGTEFFNAENIIGEQAIRVLMRYGADVAPADRLTVKGQTYYIADVENVDERCKELIITARRNP